MGNNSNNGRNNNNNKHLIYYDENIFLNSENYGYVKKFKDKISGGFFPVKDISTLKKLVEKLKSLEINGSIILVTSGQTAEKVIPICSSIVKSIIIFCFHVEKYLHLKRKYLKIKAVLNNFNDIFYYYNFPFLNDEDNLKGSKFINFEEYSNNYVNLHKKLSEFFNEKYADAEYFLSYKRKFTDFIKTSDIDDAAFTIKCVNNIKDGSVKEFIEAYTGETQLCYSLNKWMRNCDSYEYDKIKYFAGPFSYALHQYAYKKKGQGVYHTKTFYRKMTIKLSDYYMYKISIGELICYPSFTSTSEKDISKYNFPTNIAKNVNKLTPNDISIVLIIDYKCKNFLFFNNYPTPCVNASQYSVNSGEEEYIFPPFSFFKIEWIEERDGSPDNPHIIYMSTPKKKNLLEFGLKKNKTIHYDSSKNLLYYS